MDHGRVCWSESATRGAPLLTLLWFTWLCSALLFFAVFTASGIADVACTPHVEMPLKSVSCYG